MKEYDGRVRLVFKDRPLPIHTLARARARGRAVRRRRRKVLALP